MAKIDAAKLGEYIREQRGAAQISLRQLAKAAGVSNPYLSQVERGLRRPSAEILSRIAAGLRISAETLYVRAGILEDRPGDGAFLTALAEDPTLNERQRRALLDIYAAFQAENSAPAGDSTPPASPAPAGDSTPPASPAPAGDSTPTEEPS